MGGGRSLERGLPRPSEHQLPGLPRIRPCSRASDELLQKVWGPAGLLDSLTPSEPESQSVNYIRLCPPASKGTHNPLSTVTRNTVSGTLPLLQNRTGPTVGSPPHLEADLSR